MVPALVCTFLRISTTVHWVATPRPARDSESGSQAPCMDLFLHVLSACSDSSQHEHLCGWVRDASRLLPPHPRRCLNWNMEKAYTGRKEVKALQTGALALYLLLHIGCYEFGYSAQTKRWETFTQEWRLPTSPGLPGVTAVGHRAFFSCCPGYFNIPYSVTWLVICLRQLIVYSSDLPLAFCSHTGFIWPTRGFFKPLIGCRHLNTGRFYIKTWISSFIDWIWRRSDSCPLEMSALQFSIIPTLTSLFVSVSSLTPSNI